MRATLNIDNGRARASAALARRALRPVALLFSALARASLPPMVRGVSLVLTVLLAGCPTGLAPLDADTASPPDSGQADTTTDAATDVAPDVTADAPTDSVLDVAPVCTTGSKQTKSVSLTFPGSSPPCPWSVNDNGAPAAGLFTARVEHVAKLGLPAGAVLCEMTFDVPESGLSFNDGMLLTFDEAVLIGGDVDVPTLFPASGGLNIYDWQTMLNQSGALPVFCIGNSSCAPPTAQNQGVISLVLDAVSQQALARRANTLGRFEFMMVVTGDQDTANDCAYTPFTLNVTATYVAP